MPLLRRASIKRLAAMAAPPILSDVLMISILMVAKFMQSYVFLLEKRCGFYFFPRCLIGNFILARRYGGFVFLWILKDQ